MPGLFPDDLPADAATGPPAPGNDRSDRSTGGARGDSRAGWIAAHCDGGARGNPGPAGFGAVIVDADGLLLAELSEFLGFRTNNYAEYAGLLAVLAWALEHGHRRLRVVSDSLLMVRQIQGKFKVASPDLRPLWEEAKRRIARLEAFEIAHALRHKNKAADRLANEAMDRGQGRTGSVAKTPSAIPYPRPSEAPPMPPSLGGVRENAGLASGRPHGQGAPQPADAHRTTGRPATAQPSHARPAAAPAMLRGFIRDGAVHLLGSERLPDGIFVKIIPE